MSLGLYRNEITRTVNTAVLLTETCYIEKGYVTRNVYILNKPNSLMTVTRVALRYHDEFNMNMGAILVEDRYD